jgi:hypothetical protein
MPPSPIVPRPASPPPVDEAPPREAGDAPADLDALRAGFAALAESDALDKATSLRLLRLHHGYESLLLHERHVSKRDAEALRHAIERMQLQNELDRLARRRTLDEASAVPAAAAAVASARGRFSRG